jgi:predicted RecA/RadA family phage recombinase
VAAGSSVYLSEILSTTNADGSFYSWINVYDATGGNNFVKNGVEIDASVGAWVSASDLANTTIKGDSQASEQTLWLQTYEGGTYSDWDSLVLTTTGSTASVAQPIGSLDDQSVATGSSVYLSEILSSTNADGSSYSWINVYDATGGNNFVKNGVEIDASAGAWVSASDLANTTIKGDSQASEQTLWFQTYDGTDYSAWDSVILTTAVEI